MLSKQILLYGIALAMLVFVLLWLEQNYGLRRFSTEAYIIALAILFAALGVWLGSKFFSAKATTPFQINRAALEQLALTDRELQALQLIAKGFSNQEVAEQMHLSLATVKTHLNNLYQKLEVPRRTLAIEKARTLKLIP